MIKFKNFCSENTAFEMASAELVQQNKITTCMNVNMGFIVYSSYLNHINNINSL